MTLEKNFESPLHCKEIKLVNFKGNQHWLFTGRAIAEAEAPIVWPSDVKSQLIWKDPAGKGWRQKEKAEAKDKIDRITNSVDMNLSKLGEIVEDKRSLACNSPWGCRVRHDLVTEKQQQQMLLWIRWDAGKLICFPYLLQCVWSHIYLAPVVSGNSSIET